MPHADTARVLRLAAPFAVAVAAIAAGYGFSVTLSGYLVYLGISVIVACIAILGLGVVTGSAGMIALCQLTFAAVGAWFVSGLNVIGAPGGFVAWLAVGGVAAGAAGILVGLPALRLRGVNLAVVTLGLAAAADVALVQVQFPGTASGTFVPRPGPFADDRSYFVFSVIVLVACATTLYVLQHSRWGSSWKSVAFSERGTAAAGTSVPRSKLTAFAVSAALGGISGGLLAGQVGLALPASFTPLQSLALYVLSIMAGAYLIDMALFGALLWVAVPELLKRWGVPQDWGFVVFGALGVQALASGTNLGAVIRTTWWNRTAGRARRQAATRTLAAPVTDVAAQPPAAAPGGAPVLEVSNLSVSFGQVQALRDVNLAVPQNAVVGLIGPNGAGKSTLVDVISGFLPRAEGTVTLDGTSMAGLSPTRRARLGLRRTFQQDRVPPGLTVDAYVRFVARRRLSHDELAGTLEFFGCPPPRTRLSTVDVGTRRIIEVVGHLLARPRVMLLDEPAAGLSHDEHIALAERLRQVPHRFGVSVLLIEHDLDLVRSVCDTITVLDFGEVLAAGPQEEVLSDPAVLKAYMGETEML
ncbi:ATP-binding cassette domain-containing protein [Actinobacteria bacterium YIM 96077]|uniref:Branched-chain amino acid ABC transporter permease n=1 Tax=Phytoactinopolyspora halophila TaxID=1981511 RepID=A0A329QJQ8_9ACTN|nr:ATP-binding cassette domain-containing protein [Phytoactinopolyspora halophila]AYY12532.1 ATP-binding cassette domain-containing protein [Actinobacteria bacterium YIM 96077]RAW12564.1 branched-chain amino acid ABC transporter permease [Phytoactinopolyspora halophila]